MGRIGLESSESYYSPKNDRAEGVSEGVGRTRRGLEWLVHARCLLACVQKKRGSGFRYPETGRGCVLICWGFSEILAKMLPATEGLDANSRLGWRSGLRTSMWKFLSQNWCDILNEGRADY